MLYAAQYIESGKDNGSLAFKKLPDEALIGLHLLCDMAEECAFPELAFLEEPFVELRVYFVHVLPCL